MKQLLQKQARCVRGGDMTGTLVGVATVLVTLGVGLQDAKASKPPSNKQGGKKGGQGQQGSKK